MNFFPALASLLCPFVLLDVDCALSDPMYSPCADERFVRQSETTVAEDVFQNDDIAQKVSSVKLYVSLTSSPARLEHLELVLRTIDLSFVEHIILVLPKVFRGEEYTIPDHVLHFPKLKIIRILEDRGPISKLLGTFELGNIYEGREVAEEVLSDPENRIVTIDDDTGYPKNTMRKLLKAAVLNAGVIAVAAGQLSAWGVERAGWPDLHNEEDRSPHTSLDRYDVVEGFGGVIYKVGDVEKAMHDMLTLIRLSKACFNSDDLVISFALARNNIKRFKLGEAASCTPFQFSYGFSPDALHRGAGLEGEESPVNMNRGKYQRCFKNAVEFFGKF